MALTAAEQAYAAELVARTAMPLSVAQLWVAAEGGKAGYQNNFLNILGGNASFPTPQAGADAAANWILNMPNYVQIRSAISTGNATNILRAIVASPWDSNHYQGTSFGAYVASLSGGTDNGVVLPPGTTESTNGVYTIPSTTPTTGCLITAPKLLGIGGGCLLSYTTARKIGGVAALAGGAIVMGLGMWMIVGGTVQPPIEKYLKFVSGTQQRAAAAGADKATDSAKARNDQLEREYDEGERQTQSEAAAERRRDELQARREQRRARRIGRVYDAEGRPA